MQTASSSYAMATMLRWHWTASPPYLATGEHINATAVRTRGDARPFEIYHCAATGSERSLNWGGGYMGGVYIACGVPTIAQINIQLLFSYFLRENNRQPQQCSRVCTNTKASL